MTIFVTTNNIQQTTVEDVLFINRWNFFVFHLLPFLTYNYFIPILEWLWKSNSCYHVRKKCLPALIKGQYHYLPILIWILLSATTKSRQHRVLLLRVFFFLFSFADARFFDLSSTYYSDKRQSPAQFWQLWFKSTPLYSNRPGQKPYNGNIFGGKGSGGRKKPATLRPEVTPTIGVFFRTDSQFSVEQSVATKVYEQSSYGRSR